jgi:aminocarboxymuconate-semialdehyde decarboxylase
VTPEFTDPAAKLAQLARLRLDAAVVSVAPPLFCHDTPVDQAKVLCGLINEGLAAFAAHDTERLRWLAHLPLQDPDAAVDALEQAVEAGAVGAQIASSVAGVPLDRAGLEPLFAAAARLDVALLLHPAYNNAHGALDDWYLQNAIGNQLETTIAAERLLLSGVLERHADLRLVLVHAGGYLPWQIGRLRHAATVRPELTEAPSDLENVLRRVVVDTITHDPTILRMLVERMGEEHVVMGTDLPFDMAPPDPVGELLEAVDEATAGRIMEETPARVFRLRQTVS